MKYGHMPPKVAEANPWEKLCVDLIGPYTIHREAKDSLQLKCLTMIDPATGWFERHEYSDKRAGTIANLVEQQWLTRYPLPSLITNEKGKEFIGEDFEKHLAQSEYDLKVKRATTANPQSNAILERVHQTIGNMLRTYELEEMDFEEEDPFMGRLAVMAFSVQYTYHSTLEATPGKMVFGRDMIFNIKHISNWREIQKWKQDLIDKNNHREKS